MRKIFISNCIATFLFLINSHLPISCEASWFSDVKDAIINNNLPEKTYEIKIPVGNFTFPNGKTMEFTLGIGSTLFHSPNDPINVFYAATDRGINIDCADDTKIIGMDLCETGKIFPLPNYTPSIYRVTLSPDGSWSLSDPITFKDQNNKPITGLSNPIPSTENCYDGYGKPLPLDPNGLDVEAFVRLSDGSFYLGEEYAPSLVHVAPDGRILKRIVPIGLKSNLSTATYPIVEGLPAILAKRHLNRGIESVAVSPDETTLYFALQSPLDNPNADAYKSSKMVRLLRYDLIKQSVTAEFVYQMDPPNTFAKDPNSKQSDVKISEMMVLPNGRLIVLERISNTTKLYAIEPYHLNDGINILGSKYDDPSLTDSLEKKGIYPSFILPKQLLFNSDWVKNAASKVEGFSILIDDILVIINDNDFGIEGDTTRLQIIRLDKLST